MNTKTKMKVKKIPLTFQMEAKQALEFKRRVPRRQRTQLFVTMLENFLNQSRKAELLQLIDDIKPIKSSVSSVDTLRMIREGKQEELDNLLSKDRKHA